MPKMASIRCDLLIFTVGVGDTIIPVVLGAAVDIIVLVLVLAAVGVGEGTGVGTGLGGLGKELELGLGVGLRVESIVSETLVLYSGPWPHLLAAVTVIV